MRVLAAMSGGVDSAVAAARAVDAGHDVTGVHLALAKSPESHRTGARGCCTVEDARDARRAADILRIPFYVWDLADRFEQDVIDEFVTAYEAGRTPNPCVRCNERIKFAAVLDRALALGFDAVVTGHHAQLSGAVLRRSVDPDKDQSYVLGTLRPEQLAHAIFPLGDTTKTEVRAEAARRGLAVADKPDSHDICFIADGDTGRWLRERLGSRPGPVVDAVTGETVGEHDGAFAFTIGQRRGLRLGRPAPDGKPRYVLDIAPVTATVTVGPAEALDVHSLVADPVVWPYEGPVVCTAQVRAHGRAVPATAQAVGDELHVRLDEPVRGTAPGQAVVLYDGDRVLGGGHIRRLGAGESGSGSRGAGRPGF
ncbi:tRNA 2-thiouridine(34) synthase MnmA [Frankia sp. Cr1]|uniref:tRNA 2-thiouridine(34) synthase MnmA n=1 Tax=Frankia sp. Cr1 TaxID=3073931 RepID=UPI002AD5894C|nr:tRNA 2-thiouridine(34) synthase MnmA [Frankia sp. Cr1]